MSRLGKKVVRWVYDGNKTICIIQEPQKSKEETAEVIVSGEVKRYVKDTADKRLGRKLSFERAMTQAVSENLIPKEERKEIWNDFRETIKQPVVYV